MRRDGFTLLELLTVTTLLIAAGGMIWQTWFTINESADLLDKQATGGGEALRVMGVAGRELRQASLGSLSALPANALTFQIVADMDGDGLPLDAAGALELSAPRTFTRDLDDANGDGLREQQLVLITEEGVEVLSNNLAPPAQEGPDPGVWFEQSANGVRLTVQTRDTTRRGRSAPGRLEVTIRPRNP